MRAAAPWLIFLEMASTTDPSSSAEGCGSSGGGISAALIGTVPAVVVGGIGTMAVAGIWAYTFPALRKARHLTGRV